MWLLEYEHFLHPYFKSRGRNRSSAGCGPSGDESDAETEFEEEVDSPVVQSGASFIQILKRRVTESHRFAVPISLLYLKIEEYDVVKRKYGSTMARQLVDAAAPAVQKPLREMDHVTKLDNGEFIIMMPGSTYFEAIRIVKHMHSAAASCVLPLTDRELQIRFHHGAAESRRMKPRRN